MTSVNAADLFKPGVITSEDVGSLRKDAAVDKARKKQILKDAINEKLGLGKPAKEKKEPKEAKAPVLSNTSAKVLAKAMEKAEDKKSFQRKWAALKKIRAYVRHEGVFGKDTIPPEAKKATIKMSEEELKEMHESIKASIAAKAVKPACDKALLGLFYMIEYVVEDMQFNPLGWKLRGRVSFSDAVAKAAEEGELESEMTEIAIEFGSMFETGPVARLAMKLYGIMTAVTLANRLSGVNPSRPVNASEFADL